MGEETEPRYRVGCFLCKHQIQFDDPEDFTVEFASFEVHLVSSHKVIIPKFANWEEFSRFYSSIESLEQLQQSDRCSPFIMSRLDQAATYIIIDKDRLDDSFRSSIEQDFIGNILKIAQDERSCTNFSRSCLFCKKTFVQNRALLFDHLHHDHNFFLGHPDNVINAYQLFDILENKLKLLQCLYCEKNFKTWSVLKEHMRKKGHKLLNPNNRDYDKFYLINYLCGDKHWKQIKQENDFFESNEEWNDWVGDDKLDCLCFFCSFKGKFVNTKKHMRDAHDFDFNVVLSFPDFYDRIKVINFIRKRLFVNQCFNCDFKCSNFESLMEHLSTSSHMTEVPPKDLFNHPEYYFSTFDDDYFLFYLEEFRNEE